MVEKSSGVKPCNITDAIETNDERQIIGLILEKYNSFSFYDVEVCQARKQLKSLDGKKSTIEDQIPPKLVLLAADELALPLTNAINSTKHSCKLQKNGKSASVCPLDKGEANRTDERNFRPVSILNVFSKIYKKFL